MEGFILFSLCIYFHMLTYSHICFVFEVNLMQASRISQLYICKFWESEENAIVFILFVLLFEITQWNRIYSHSFYCFLSLAMFLISLCLSRVFYAVYRLCQFQFEALLFLFFYLCHAFHITQWRIRPWFNGFAWCDYCGKNCIKLRIYDGLSVLLELRFID